MSVANFYAASANERNSFVVHSDKDKSVGDSYLDAQNRFGIVVAATPAEKGRKLLVRTDITPDQLLDAI